ncbi:MAG TPA: CoA transferase [Candidatus Saccharimonadales bacterium]|nr:CoA transferase [Candidatus Saccharimonadales bacterium]
MPALDDVRVLDLTRLLPGPFCTMLLADFGADVIKVEDTTGGDYMRWMAPVVGEYSAMFHPVNRNKRSLAIDLKNPLGHEVFLRLVDGADVVVESFRPGVMDRLGIGYDALHERSSRVVLCSISGYGQDGPYRDHAGHDLNYAAVAGVLLLGGTVDAAPAMPGLQVGDLGGGALHAALAIMVALHHAARTGEGQHCDISMVDGLISWASVHASQLFATGVAPEPGNGMLTGRYPCYRIYACADGFLSVGTLEPKFWHAFVHAIGVPEVADRGFAEGAEGESAIAAVQAVLMGRTRAEWREAFDGLDVCVEPVLALDETFEHPQVRSREMRLDAGAGRPTAQTGFPIRLTGSPASFRRGAPGYGEHTDEVLIEAGYDAAALASMRAAKVIR